MLVSFRPAETATPWPWDEDTSGIWRWADQSFPELLITFTLCVTTVCVCVSQVCEVQTSQSDVGGQHVAKGAAGKVRADWLVVAKRQNLTNSHHKSEAVTWHEKIWHELRQWAGCSLTGWVKWWGQLAPWERGLDLLDMSGDVR